VFPAMTAIDDALIEASNDLGASPTQTLFNVIVPLSLPGVFAGFVLTLGSALAAWVEPEMLGGGFVNLLSNSVESAFTALRYPVVAALTTFVIALASENYVALFEDLRWVGPCVASLVVGLIVALVCTVVATFVGRAIPLLRNPGRVVLLTLLPLFVPGMSMGAALFIFFRSFLG